MTENVKIYVEGNRKVEGTENITAYPTNIRESLHYQLGNDMRRVVYGVEKMHGPQVRFRVNEGKRIDTVYLEISPDMTLVESQTQLPRGILFKEVGSGARPLKDILSDAEYAARSEKSDVVFISPGINWHKAGRESQMGILDGLEFPRFTIEPEVVEGANVEYINIYVRGKIDFGLRKKQGDIFDRVVDFNPYEMD